MIKMKKVIDVERMAEELGISVQEMRRQFKIPEPPTPLPDKDEQELERLRDQVGYKNIGKPKTGGSAFEALFAFITETKSDGWNIGGEDYRFCHFSDALKDIIKLAPTSEKGKRLKEVAHERWRALIKSLLPQVESSHDAWWLHKHSPGKTDESKVVWRRWQEVCLQEIEEIKTLEDFENRKVQCMRLPSLGKAKSAYGEKVCSLVSMALITAQTLEQISKLARNYLVFSRDDLRQRVFNEWERLAMAEVQHAESKEELQKLLGLCAENASSYQLAIEKLATFYEKET